MQRKNKVKLLVLSVSVLLLLIIVYSAGTNRTHDESSGKTLATIVREAALKTSAFFKDSYSNFKAKQELRREEKKAREAAEAFLLNSENENVINEDAPLLEEPDITEALEEYVTEYVDPFEINVPDELNIPAVVGDTEFRSVRDYVYAKEEANLYEDPSCEGGALGKSFLWQEFLRVGISKDCCYQLVTEDGRLVYSDGSHYKRNREDMPLTEEITLPEGDSALLDVEYVSQFPTLPNGCEVTSLATVLKYLGFNITKDELADSFLPKKKVGKANFYYEFVGDPSSRNSYGCYAPAIVTTATNYFEFAESDLQAVDLTGFSFQDLLIKVKAGYPVIVWAAANLESEPKDATEWIVDGEYLVWKDNLHCMVLIGYDISRNIVIVSDPMKGINEYDMDLFIKRYKQFYSQAVLIEQKPAITD